MNNKTVLLIIVILSCLLLVFGKLKIIEFFGNDEKQNNDSNKSDKHKQIIDKYKNKKKIEEIKKPTNETIDLFYNEKPLEIFYDVFEYSDPWSDRMDIEKKNKE